MPKHDSHKHGVHLLPGLAESEALDRRTRLRAWFRHKGLSYADLARRWECHWTWPGKCLDSETEELPETRRRDLVDNLGCPEEILPPPWNPETKRARNQARYQKKKAARRRRKVDSFRQEYEEWKQESDDSNC